MTHPEEVLPEGGLPKSPIPRRVDEPRRVSPRSREAVACLSPPESEADPDHSDSEQEVEPVVRRVEGDEVEGAVEVDYEAVDPEDEVEGASTDEEETGGLHVLAVARPRTPKSRWTKLGTMFTWKMPRSFASDSCPMNPRSS